MLIFPGFRMMVMAFVLRLTMGAPDIQLIENAPAQNRMELDLRAQDTKGNQLYLADVENTVIFVNIWATWCGPCVAEMSSIEDLYADYGTKVKFVLLSFEDSDKVQEFQQSRNISMPLYTPVATVPALFHTDTYPTTLIINKKGAMIVKEKGAANWNHDDVRILLDDLIKA